MRSDETHFPRLAAELLRRKEEGRCLVVGISGIDASGKTTYARRLAQALGEGCARLVHADDFLAPSPVRNQGMDACTSYIQNAFRLDALASELLAPCKTGERVAKTLCLLDGESDTLSREVRFDLGPEHIVLLEGVLLFRPPVDEFLDVRIFLEVEGKSLQERILERDAPLFGPKVLERYRAKYFPAHEWYLREHAPRERADYVVDNTQPEGRFFVRFRQAEAMFASDASVFDPDVTEP